MDALLRLLQRLQAFDATLRAEARREAVALPPEASSGLIAALAHPAAEVRGEVALVLAARREAAALEPLAAAALRELRDATRALLVRALAELASPRSAGALGPALARLAADPDPFVRAQACVALGRAASEAALPILRGAAGDPEPFVREAAARALVVVCAGADPPAEVWGLVDDLGHPDVARQDAAELELVALGAAAVAPLEAALAGGLRPIVRLRAARALAAGVAPAPPPVDARRGGSPLARSGDDPVAEEVDRLRSLLDGDPDG